MSEIEVSIVVDDSVLQSIAFLNEREIIQHQIVDFNTALKIGKISFAVTEDRIVNAGSTKFQQKLKRPADKKLTLQSGKRTGLALKSVSVIPTVAKKECMTSAATSHNASKIDVSSMMSSVENMATGEKSYKCSFCGSESAHLTSIRRHIETKHLPSTVSFDCRQCDYKTKLKFMLKKHYTNKHQMPEMAAQGMMAYY